MHFFPLRCGRVLMWLRLEEWCWGKLIPWIPSLALFAATSVCKLEGTFSKYWYHLKIAKGSGVSWHVSELCCRLPSMGSVAVPRDGGRAVVLTVAETLSKAGTACPLPACCCLTLTYHFCVQWDHLKMEFSLLWGWRFYDSYHSFPRNIIHGSDSLESAEAEINLWFSPEELVDYRSCAHEWIYE